MTFLFEKTNTIKARASAIPGKTIAFLFSILLHILIIFLLVSTRFPIRQKLIQEEFREIKLISKGEQIVTTELGRIASKKRLSGNPKMTHHPDSGTIPGTPFAQIPELDFSLILANNMLLSKKLSNPLAGIYSSSGFLNLKKPDDPEGVWKLRFPGQLKIMPSIPTDPLNMLNVTGKNPYQNNVSLVGDNQIDLTTWSENILDRIHQQWIVPSSAVAGQKGRVKILARIKADGTILSVKLTNPSSEETYNQAATKAVIACNPLPPLPDNFYENWVDVVVLFCYND